MGEGEKWMGRRGRGDGRGSASGSCRGGDGGREGGWGRGGCPYLIVFFILGLLSRGVKDPEVGCLMVVECVL